MSKIIEDKKELLDEDQILAITEIATFCRDNAFVHKIISKEKAYENAKKTIKDITYNDKQYETAIQIAINILKI